MLTSRSSSRCIVVALGALTAATLAACGSSGTPAASPTSSASTSKPSSASTAPSAAPAKDRLTGIVGSVSGGTITLNGAAAPGSVDVTPATHVTQLVPALLTDVTAGECVAIRPTRDSAGSPNVTAASVLLSPVDGNGQCAPAGGRKGNGVSGNGVSGTVASVTGTAITVTPANGAPSTVAVTPTTRYAKRTIVQASAITVGECVMAQGTKAGDGSLQATSIGIRPTGNGGRCGKR